MPRALLISCLVLMCAPVHADGDILGLSFTAAPSAAGHRHLSTHPRSCWVDGTFQAWNPGCAPIRGDQAATARERTAVAVIAAAERQALQDAALRRDEARARRDELKRKAKSAALEKAAEESSERYFEASRQDLKEFQARMRSGGRDPGSPPSGFIP